MSQILEHKFTAYDLNWGQPFGSYDYDGLVLSMLPEVYIKGDEDGYNLGTLGGLPTPTTVSWDSGTVFDADSMLGLPRSLANLTSGDFGIYDNPSPLNADEFTVMFWVSSDHTSGTRSTNSEVLLTFGVDGDVDLHFTLTTTGILKVFWENSVIYTSTTSFVTGNSYFVVFTQRGGSWRLYINGSEVGDGTGLSAMTTSAYPYIGLGTFSNSGGAEALPANHIRLKGYLEAITVLKQNVDAATVTKLHVLGRAGAYYNPLQDLDVAPQNLTTVQEDFEDYITSLAPAHWYRLHETTGTTAADSGSEAVNSTYSGPTISVTGPLHSSNGTSRGRALYGDNSSKIVSDARLFPSTTALDELDNGFSLSFYTIQGANFSRNKDVLFSMVNRDGTNSYGFFAYIQKDAVTFEKWNSQGRWAITIPAQYLPQVNGSSDVDATDWALYTITIDANGLMRAHVNDTTDVAPPVQTVGPGIRVGDSTSRLTIGYVGPVYDTNPEHFWSEYQLYDRALTSGEISSMYYVAKFGKNYARYIVSDDTDSSAITGYEVEADPLPSLENGTDLTPYLTGIFSIETSIDQLVSTGSIEVKDSAISSIRDIVKPNNVIKIEERVHSLDRRTVSDWTTLAVMAVDGIPQDSASSDGARNRNLMLKSLTRAFTFDAGLQFQFEPDRFQLRRATCSLHQIAPDAYEFVVPRIEDTDKFYSHYAPYPTPRIRVSKFQNLEKFGADPAEDWKANELPPEVVVKAAEQSVQFLGGLGIIRIDTDYFEDPLAYQVGLGNPDYAGGGVKLDADRYCIPDDEFNSNIIAMGVVDGKWAVQIDNPDAREVGRTIFINSGNTKNPIYKLFPIYGSSALTPWFRFQTVTEGTGLVGWGDTTGVPAYDAFTGDGEQGNALASDSTSAYTAEGAASSYTNTLDFTNIDFSGIADDQEITGIEIEVKRWAYSPHQSSYAFHPWGTTNNQVNEYLLQLTMDGVLVGTNQAVTGRVLYADDYRYDAPNIERVVYGGPQDLLGFQTLNVSSLPSLGFRIQAAFGTSGENARAAIESVAIRFYTSPKKGSEEWHQIADYHGAPVNPFYEGIDTTTSMVVGNSNRIERVMLQCALLAGFQVADADRPLYIDIEELPSEYNVIIPPMLTIHTDGLTLADIMEEALNYAFPNYRPRPTADGGMELRQYIQRDIPDFVLDTVDEVAADSSDTNIYTRVRIEGEGGDAVNLGTQAAIRACKLDNWAVTGSTTSGTGELSAKGKAYNLSDTDMATMNGTLQQIFDSSQLTPQLSGGGWTKFNAQGVIWAMSGRDVQPYAMEDQDLFIVDLGRNVQAGREYLIEALQFSTWNTFFVNKDNTIPLQISVEYMTEHDYMRVKGKYPPDYPDQDDADLADSYFPPADAWTWRTLLDQVQLPQDQQTTFEAQEFETTMATGIRFLKVRVHQSEYYDGKGVEADRRARIGLTDMKIWTSRKIVATATLGKTDPFRLGTHKEAVGRLRYRTYSFGKNPQLDSYESCQNYAIQNLTELVQEFMPRALRTLERGVLPGHVVQFRDYRTNETVNILVRSTVKNQTSLACTGVDYRLNSEGFR